MSLDRPERDPAFEVRAEDPGGSGWRRRLGLDRSGSVALRLVVLVLLVVAGAWAYVSNFGPWARPAMNMDVRVTSGATPFPVTLARVERGPVRGTVIYTGSVAPINEEDVYPRVTGRIVEIPVYPGDAVRAGQIVARLDDVELSSRMREAEAGLATAQANRAQMDADLIAAQQEVVHMEKELVQAEAEATYWRSVIARTERLFASGAVSRQDYESDRSMAASYEAKREAARAKLDQVRAMETAARKKIEAAEFMVAQSRAQLRTAQVVHGYATIASPSGGYVVKRLVAPGVLVQPGTVILKIAQVDRVRLQANVGEKDMASIHAGSPVTVTLAGAGQAPIAARVTSVFPFVDQGSRTAVVEAVIENTARRLLPGQYVQMEFVTGERPDALTVPRGAVSRLGGQARVWVVKDGRAEPREVTTGLESPGQVEVLHGLSGGERVVARGHEGLYAGARIADLSGAVPAPPAPKATGHEGMAMPGDKPALDKPAANKPGTEMPGMDTPATQKPKEGGHAGH